MAAAGTRSGPAATGVFRVVMAAVRGRLTVVSLGVLWDLLTPVSRIQAPGDGNFGDRSRGRRGESHHRDTAQDFDAESGARSTQKSPLDSP
jgi:hypothetical protein